MKTFNDDMKLVWASLNKFSRIDTDFPKFGTTVNLELDLEAGDI